MLVDPSEAFFNWKVLSVFPPTLYELPLSCVIPNKPEKLTTSPLLNPCVAAVTTPGLAFVTLVTTFDEALTVAKPCPVPKHAIAAHIRRPVEKVICPVVLPSLDAAFAVLMLKDPLDFVLP
jgi:hypothetical protein